MCSASGWSACCCTHSAAWLHVVLASCTGTSWPLNATMMCAGLCTIYGFAGSVFQFALLLHRMKAPLLVFEGCQGYICMNCWHAAFFHA